MAAAAAGARKLAGTLRLLAAGRGSGRFPQAQTLPCETSFFPYRSYSAAKTGESGRSTDGGKRSRARKIVSIGVISIAGGVALSALNDLAMFHGCRNLPFLSSETNAANIILRSGSLSLSILIRPRVNAFSKAIKKATENKEEVEAIGVPIVRGPWYDASLAVGHRRRSVSCTFPVSGPQFSGIFQFKAFGMEKMVYSPFYGIMAGTYLSWRLIYMCLQMMTSRKL